MKYQPKVFLFLGIFLLVVWLTAGYWESWFLAFISFIFSVSVFLIAILIFLENKDPQKTLTWLVVLASFPVVGFIFYLLFGSFYRRKRMFKLKAKQDSQEFAQIKRFTHYDNKEYLSTIPQHQYRFFQLANNIGLTPISFASTATVLTDGEQTYASMLHELESAEHHIHMEYYIIRNDEVGRQFKQILMKKAQEGIEVRLIYDSVGCFQLPRHFIHELRQAGVQVAQFNPVTFPLLNSRINFRNHRKIIVIDAQIGFVGGLNIGDEYLGKKKFFGFWRDTHLKIEREAVRSLQTIFLLDWYYLMGEKMLNPQYLSPIQNHSIESTQAGGLQIISSGPDQEWEVMKKLFFAMITSATQRICITSPYLIPDDDILSALKIAALSGIEVSIILPSKPDKKVVFWASRSYFTELIQAGVHIYLYRKGFLHSKALIVDDELASIGSANMDMRSFHLNFEVNAFLYRHEGIQELVCQFDQDLLDADLVDLQRFRSRKWLHRLYESIARLFSPLL